MKRILLLGAFGFTLFLLAVGFSTAPLAAQQKVHVTDAAKGWLGVAIQDITTEMKRAKDLDSRDGALVSDVTRKSPADSAGIKDGDVIVQFAGKKIEDSGDLQKAVAETKPGTKVPVVLLRKGEKKTIDVVVGKQVASHSAMAIAPRGGRTFSFTPRGTGNLAVAFGGGNTQGMSLKEMNDQMAQYFGITDKPGVLVWEVEKESAAEKAGLKAGDVITVVGKKKINEMRDVHRALGIYDEGEKAEIEVLRKGNRQTVMLEVEETSDTPGAAFWYGNPGAAHREKMMFHGEPFDVRIPHIELDGLKPDMDHLRIELDEMKERINEDASGIREKILKEVKPRMRVRIQNVPAGC